MEFGQFQQFQPDLGPPREFFGVMGVMAVIWLVVMLVSIAVVVVLIIAAWRAMRAHESIASSMEIISKRLQDLKIPASSGPSSSLEEAPQSGGEPIQSGKLSGLKPPGEPPTPEGK